MITDPVVLTDGPGDAPHYDARARASSCYINQSCPTCAPCCLALFLGPVLYLMWPLYQNWQKSRDLPPLHPVVQEVERESGRHSDD